MNIVRYDLPPDMTTVEIELFFDLHIGSKKCDFDLIQKRVERVRDNPNVFAILGGDIINNSTRDSVGDIYEEPLNPEEQIKTAVRIFQPIKDKIICYVNGNHERRTYKQCGVDIGSKIAVMLGVDERYDYTACLLFLTYGHVINDKRGGHRQRTTDWKHLVTIYVTHGDGASGRLIGSKANSLSRRGQIIDADIIVTGHTHAPLSFRESSLRINRQAKTVSKVEQLFVNASAALGYEEYAELIGLRPSSTASPRLLLGDTYTVVI